MATIVIGTDGSQASRDAAELGLQFAEARGDRVVIVTAWPPVHDLGITDTIFDVDLMDFLHGRARRIVDEAAARASLRGLEVETVVAPGMPAKRRKSSLAASTARPSRPRSLRGKSRPATRSRSSAVSAAAGRPSRSARIGYTGGCDARQGIHRERALFLRLWQHRTCCRTCQKRSSSRR